MPSGRPTRVATTSAVTREDRGVRGALGNQIADRPVVLHRVAEVEPDGRREPVAVLRARSTCPGRSARARCSIVSRLRLDAERLGDVVARREARQDERRRRHGDDEKEREREPPREVARQWMTGAAPGSQERYDGTLTNGRASTPRRGAGAARRPSWPFNRRGPGHRNGRSSVCLRANEHRPMAARVRKPVRTR